MNTYDEKSIQTKMPGQMPRHSCYARNLYSQISDLSQIPQLVYPRGHRTSENRVGVTKSRSRRRVIRPAFNCHAQNLL